MQDTITTLQVLHARRNHHTAGAACKKQSPQCRCCMQDAIATLQVLGARPYRHTASAGCQALSLYCRTQVMHARQFRHTAGVGCQVLSLYCRWCMPGAIAILQVLTVVHRQVFSQAELDRDRAKKHSIIRVTKAVPARSTNARRPWKLRILKSFLSFLSKNTVITARTALQKNQYLRIYCKEI